MARNVGLTALGLLLGIALGLYLGWVAWPIEYTNADPALLAAEGKEDYALMVAATYAQDGDLAGARWRLARLGAEDVGEWYLDIIVDAILIGQDEADLRRLVHLAHDMGLESAAMAPYLPPDLN
jgi:hypothetical protein